jgi:Zn finger protein HypA/HybF involved in hydrogenase expression
MTKKVTFHDYVEFYPCQYCQTIKHIIKTENMLNIRSYEIEEENPMEKTP